MKIYLVYNGVPYESWVEYVCSAMEIAEAYVKNDPDRWIEEREIQE